VQNAVTGYLFVQAPRISSRLRQQWLASLESLFQAYLITSPNEGPIECKSPSREKTIAYRFYCEILALQASGYGLDIWTYYLMPNQVHLIGVPAVLARVFNVSTIRRLS